MKRTEHANITTWSDDLGAWHAHVDYDRNPRAAAQAAIWRAKGTEGPIPHVVEMGPGHWMEDSEPVEKPRLRALVRGE